MKYFFFDTETTGLDTNNCAMIQLAVSIDIDGEHIDTRQWYIRPFGSDTINTDALDIHKIEMGKILQFPFPQIVFRQIAGYLDLYVDKYDKQDKFIPVAYNGHFDISVLNSFFRKNGSEYLGSYLNFHALQDPLPILRFLYPNLPSHKLTSICEHLNIPLNAHDALSDILATKTIFYMLQEIILPNVKDIQSYAA